MQDQDHLIYDQPGHLIRRLQQIAVALFMAETTEFDITPIQYAALLAVRLHPGLDQTALVNIIALDRSTVGDVVTRLESKTLIRRAAGPDDRRTKVMYVTASGRQLLRKLDTRTRSVERLILAPLSVDERPVFLAMMQRLVHINNEHSRAPLRTKDERPRRSLARSEQRGSVRAAASGKRAR
jgi:MarR family transcriptional regulator, lower aerobic nicotinate degradation pathway regulator